MKTIYENFNNVFDSSTIDYSTMSEKKDQKWKREKILEWLKENNVVENDDTTYHINDDYSIDVHGNFALDRVNKENEIPEFIQFNNIFGYFDIQGCGLISFRGLPIYIEGYCDLSNNYAGDTIEIDNLQYLPKRIQGDLDLSDNGYCDRCNNDWQFYTNAEIEDNYYDNLFMLNSIKNNIEHCEGDIKLGENGCVPYANVNLYTIDETIADLQDDINNKIWLKWMVEDNRYEDDDEWDENCTKWVQEHWPELNFSGKKYPDDFEKDEEELDESFNNVFDSSTVDYANYSEHKDLNYIENLKKEKGYISEDEYEKIINVFKDFIDPEETRLKSLSKLSNKGYSYNSIILVLSREKFEKETGITNSSLFYKKYEFIKSNGWVFPVSETIDDSNRIIKKTQLWKEISKDDYRWLDGILICDKVEFRIKRSPKTRPNFVLKQVKHLSDGIRMNTNSRGNYIENLTLDDVINKILKRLYKPVKALIVWKPIGKSDSKFWCPTHRITKY